MSDQVFCEILRNRGGLRVQRREYRGKSFADVRIYYTHPETGTLEPTPKGCSIRPEEIRQVAEALLRCAESFEAEAD